MIAKRIQCFQLEPSLLFLSLRLYAVERRIAKMEGWLAAPELLEPDAGAEYHTIININMDDIKEPILCAPNDPDDARTLSDVMGDKIDEVFIGEAASQQRRRCGGAKHHQQPPVFSRIKL